VVTFEAANVGFENLIFQRTRPVAEAERDLVKAQNAQNTLKNEIGRHDGVIAGLTADVETARKHQEEINKQTVVLQPYPVQQPVPTYAAPTPQPVPATQTCVGKKGIRFICNKPAQDNVIKNNAQAEAEAQKTFRDTQEQIARSNAEAQAAVDKANGDLQAAHDAEVKKAGAQVEQAQAKLDAAGVSMARRISSEVAPQNSPVWRAGISRWVERRLHCWAAFRDVLVWTG
jgi:hypothetical protein